LFVVIPAAAGIQAVNGIARHARDTLLIAAHRELTIIGAHDTYRNHHSRRLCSLGRLPWNCEDAFKLRFFIHDRGHHHVCCRLVCGGGSEYVGRRIASGLFLSRRIAHLFVDILVTVRGGRAGKVEVPVSMSD